MIELFPMTLGPYVFVAAGAAACLYVFFSVKKEIQELRVRCSNRNTQLLSMVEDLEQRMEDLNCKARHAEERAGGRVAPVPPAPRMLHLH